MKKCPYCAEEIQDEAVFCRYCNHDLVDVSQGQGIIVAPSELREPPVWESLFFALIFIIFTDILLVGMVMAFSMMTGIVPDENLQVLGIAVGLLTRVVVGAVSVKGYKPKGATAINYIGMVLLVFVPIGSWVPTYYAGKAIARKVSTRDTAILIGLIVGICLLVSVPFLLNNPSLGKQSLATQTWAKPTSVQIVQPSITPIARRFPEPPQINMDVESWLQNKTPFLWDLAEGLEAGNDLVYNINLEDDSILFGGFWCSTSSTILDENWHKLSHTYIVDGISIPRGYFQTTDYDSEIDVYDYGKQPAKCRISYCGLYKWLKGNHELIVTTHAIQTIFDGWGNIPAGTTYRTIYHVNVKTPRSTVTPDCIMWNHVSKEHEDKFICVNGKSVVFYEEFDTFEDKKMRHGETEIEYRSFRTGNIGVSFDQAEVRSQNFGRFFGPYFQIILTDQNLFDFDIQFKVIYDCVKFWGRVVLYQSQDHPTDIRNLQITKIELCK